MANVESLLLLLKVLLGYNSALDLMLLLVVVVMGRCDDGQVDANWTKLAVISLSGQDNRVDRSDLNPTLNDSDELTRPHKRHPSEEVAM